jgi:adenylate cyclase
MPADETQAYILVVDDNEMNRDMLARRLERQGFQVELAENGERALEMMNQADFDLVLLDIMMPRMNGYEVLQHVKADSRLSQIPIIMISALDDLDSVVKCIEMGAEDYLFKPFNPVLLKARVGASLGKRRDSSAAQPVAPATRPERALSEVQEAANAIMTDAQYFEVGSGAPVSREQAAILERIMNNARYILDQLES